MKTSGSALQPIQPRRRVLRLLAAMSVVGLATATGVLAGRFSGANSSLHRWRGTAMGADATLLIHHPDAAVAVHMTKLALAEIERLEKIYSLHRLDSALVRLNREGRLDDPPAELVALLTPRPDMERSQRWCVRCNGSTTLKTLPTTIIPIHRQIPMARRTQLLPRSEILSISAGWR